MYEWFIIIITIVFSAFFSGIEIAFVSANKLKIELDRNKGLIAGKIISHFSKSPSDFIATMLVGNNIAIVIYGIFMSEILMNPIIRFLPESLNSHAVIFIIQTIISTLLILITAEFIPKNLFRINPNYTLNLFAFPAAVLYYVLFPVAYVAISLAEFILKVFFKTPIPSGKRVLGPVDLDNYLKEFFADARNEDELEQEIQIFQNAMEFQTVKLRECMIPRTEIIGIEETENIAVLKNTFIESGLSKILIFSKTIDNITGYVHQYDMFRNPGTIKAILRPIIYVPESMLASNLLTMFIEQRKSIAVVVDEFGGTSGILTMEDVIEEIFGEINDEYDVEILTEKQINEKEFIFSGRLEIDYINEKYHLNLPKSEEYETLTGLIFHHHQSVPEKDEEIFIGNFIITITSAGRNKIEQLHIKLRE